MHLFAKTKSGTRKRKKKVDKMYAVSEAAHEQCYGSVDFLRPFTR